MEMEKDEKQDGANIWKKTGKHVKITMSIW